VLTCQTYEQNIQGANGRPPLVVTEQHINCYHEERLIVMVKDTLELKKKHPTPKAKSTAAFSFAMKSSKDTKAPPNAPWPCTIPEMAQALIIAVFRGNEKLCMQLAEGTNVHSLLDMFCHIINKVYFAYIHTIYNIKNYLALLNTHAYENKSASEPNKFVDSHPALDFLSVICMPTPKRALKVFQVSQK
jgi:hypothetical protein